MQELIGTQILQTWDDKDRQGWFQGTVHGRNLTEADHVRAPTVNFAVRYTKSLTIGARNRCELAHELTSRTCGDKKLWVVIVKDE